MLSILAKSLGNSWRHHANCFCNLLLDVLDELPPLFVFVQDFVPLTEAAGVAIAHPEVVDDLEHGSFLLLPVIVFVIFNNTV